MSCTIIEAAENGNVNVLRQLIDSGVDINQRDLRKVC